MFRAGMPITVVVLAPAPAVIGASVAGVDGDILTLESGRPARRVRTELPAGRVTFENARLSPPPTDDLSAHPSQSTAPSGPDRGE